LGFLVLLVAAAACSAGPTFPPVPTWPVPAEILPQATSGGAASVITCGGRTFPASGLSAPTGAEKASGPEFDALRASLLKFGPEFPGSDAWTWQLAGRDATGATFLARTDGLDSDWAAVEVAVDASGWHPMSMGGCNPHAVLSADFGPASWALDPAFGTPTADTTELHILVWERSCSGGSPATGRISAPVIQSTSTTVTITIGVRPLRAPEGVVYGCPMPPGTPAILSLPAPLGPRMLLDGGTVPPAPPSPANG
jgi:hypothetical protein